MGDLEACLIVADGVNTVPVNKVSDKVTLKIFDVTGRVPGGASHPDEVHADPRGEEPL